MPGELLRLGGLQKGRASSAAHFNTHSPCGCCWFVLFPLVLLSSWYWNGYTKREI
ncbi:hypothetical protein GQ54DRAFT_212868 [Martensiomyces pterosporus]|nr:hypothetical protein GQ54DRAFT_212868 [Martensiomyces pterosporus]